MAEMAEMAKVLPFLPLLPMQKISLTITNNELEDFFYSFSCVYEKKAVSLQRKDEVLK